MKKIVKLNRAQLRSVISEAIQGKAWGEPEPFAMEGAGTVAPHDVEGVDQANMVETEGVDLELARKKAEEAAHTLGILRENLSAHPHLAEVAGEAFELAYRLMGMLDDEL